MAKSNNLMRASSWILISLISLFVGIVFGEPGKRCGDENGGANANCILGTCVNWTYANGTLSSTKYTKTTWYYACEAGDGKCSYDDFGVSCTYDEYDGWDCQGQPKTTNRSLPKKSCK